ncbi:MAG: AAA-associated domain-containing protein [Thermoplasmata archaeon]|nr:AAA-associated domain-containing protein [Thermoplasmata archaeon]
MATSYPKCSPTEMMGLIVLLNSHKGSEDIARLADDLDLEIDEILPSVDYAEVLLLVKVSDGRATLTDLGKKFLASTIRDRKSMLREQLSRTTLFRTLLRALDKAPERQLSDEELGSIVSLAQAPLEDAVQNIVNWGRYAELFRYDSDEHRLTAIRHPPAKTGGGARPPPPSAPQEPKTRAPPARTGRAASESETRTSPLAALAT